MQHLITILLFWFICVILNIGFAWCVASLIVHCADAFSNVDWSEHFNLIWAIVAFALMIFRK